MLQIFFAYIKTIVCFLIFAAFAEMIMPDNSFKKYINLVLGLIMIAVMLKPIGKLLDPDNIDIASLINLKEVQLGLKTEEVDIGDDSANTDIILDIYKEDMAENIKQEIQAKENVTVDSLTAVFNEDVNDAGFGEVLFVEVSAHAGTQIEKEWNFVRIEPVKVYGFDEAGEENESNDEELKNSIEEIISSKYSVPKENIKVSILKS